MIKNTFPNKSANPESLKKNHSSWEALQLMCTYDELLRAFYELFCLRFCISNDQ